MTDPFPVDPAAVAPDLRDDVRALVEGAQVDTNVDQVTEILQTGLALGRDRASRLDLKITAAAMAEMRAAFAMFAPYRDRPKVTIFGSARTKDHDRLYVQTHDLAAALADVGWMVITGAGPGIMQAAMEGAGLEQSIGVSIRLPFETQPNDIINGDPKHVSMKYFFTRKLMLVKESRAFVALPGGFGTLDETLELLTLQQTGKAEPTPIVLLDVPGGTYWQHFQRFVTDELVSRGMVSDDDMDRALVTDSVDAALAEITGFWHNYHSLRWVGRRLVVRMHHEPTPTEVDDLNRRFGSSLAEGRIEASGPLPPEVKGDDHVHLPRLVMVWDQWKVGGLHKLFRALNELPSANPDPGA